MHGDLHYSPVHKPLLKHFKSQIVNGNISGNSSKGTKNEDYGDLEDSFQSCIDKAATHIVLIKCKMNQSTVKPINLCYESVQIP